MVIVQLSFHVIFCSDDFTDCDDQGESLSYQGGGSMVQQTTPSTGQTEYTSVGLEALEMLHNQLQILVSM